MRVKWTFFLLIAVLLVIAGCEKKTIDYLKPSINAGENAGVGVNYWDYSPDVELEYSPPGVSEEFYIDINDDATLDLRLAYVAYQQTNRSRFSVTIETRYSTKVAVLPDHNNWAAMLHYGDTIDGRHLYHSGEIHLYTHETDTSGMDHTEGIWGMAEGAYLGVTLNSDIGTLYGWVNMEVVSDFRVVLKEYGCTIPTIVYKK